MATCNVVAQGALEPVKFIVSFGTAESFRCSLIKPTTTINEAMMCPYEAV